MPHAALTLLCSLLCLACPISAYAEEIFDGFSLAMLGAHTNTCAITFDDGPGPHTPRLLGILRERNIKATFFVLGSRAARYPQTMRAIAAEGHEVGNHTYSHVNLRNLAPETQRDEIARTDAALLELGIPVRYLRPPYGRYDKNTLEQAAIENLPIVMWSIDSRDWQSPRQPMARVLPRSSSGKVHGVFLFHDNHRSTVDAMPRILDDLAAAGCQFVTLSEYLDNDGPVCLH